MRELDQPWIVLRRDDIPKGGRVLNVRERRRTEGRVIPRIEETAMNRSFWRSVMENI